jgi:hypothetical protein
MQNKFLYNLMLMNKTLSLCLKIVSAASFVVCGMWTWKQRDFEPIAATLGSLAAFIALFMVDAGSTPKPPILTQKGGRKSNNYQSGRNMDIHPKS